MGGGREIPIRFPLYVIPSIPFSGSGPNKTRSQAVPRPPAKSNVSDPRPLIPKREGGAQNRTARTLPNTARWRQVQAGRP